MKIRIYYFSLLIICSCAKNKSNEVNLVNEIVPKIYTLKSSPKVSILNDTVFYSNKRFSGVMYELNIINKDTISIETYCNGLQNGISKKWYGSNKLMEQRNYMNGKKNGKQTVFWDNGFKKFEFTAKDDAYEGEMKEWNNNGNLIHLGNYKNGQENGTQKMWYDNGKIRANYVIIRGKRFGLLGTKNCRNVSDSIFIDN